MSCIFCEIYEKKEGIVLENDYAFVKMDGYPVTPLHALIIPKRHFDSYIDSQESELISIQQLIREMYQKIKIEDDSVVGYNIGINGGIAGGQTIFHCHIHLIPRRVGDVENPRGGVRHIIPGKGFY